MSSIGPSGFLPVSLAGNAASNATQQKEHQQTKDAVASKNFEQDLKAKTEASNNDVSDLDASGDRDADGRLLAGDETEQPAVEHHVEEAEKIKSPIGRAIDPDGEVGMQIDFEV